LHPWHSTINQRFQEFPDGVISMACRRFTLLVVLALTFATLAIAEPEPAPAPATRTATSATATGADSLDALLDGLQTMGILSSQQHDTLKQRVDAATPATRADSLIDGLQNLGVLTAQQRDVLRQRVSAAKVEEVALHDEAEAAQDGHRITALGNGIGFRVNNVDVKFTGEFNAFYVHDRAATGSAGPDVGGLASTGQVPSSSIRNGLLPGNFTISLATQEHGIDVGVVFGFWPGIQSLQQNSLGVNFAGGQATGFGTAGIDFRQQYATIGKANIGTFKIGRDLGFFGREAIFNDITLLGAGSPNGNSGPGSVTLGRIGLGYVYTDFIPQISYMSPTFSGVQLGFGVFQPFSDPFGSPQGSNGLAAQLTGHSQPQLQGKLNYTVPLKGPVKTTLWTNFVTEDMEANLTEALPNIPVGHGVRGTGADFGAKVGIGPATLVAYGYKGWGLGTEGLFFLSTTATGHTRNSQGYYYQGTYTVAKKLTFGASYGLSHLDLASGDLPDSGLVKSNSSYVGQVRYALTKWCNLVQEYTHTISQAHNGVRATDDSIAGGTILFF
jgi:hypothetical protein